MSRKLTDEETNIVQHILGEHVHKKKIIDKVKVKQTKVFKREGSMPWRTIYFTHQYALEEPKYKGRLVHEFWHQVQYCEVKNAFLRLAYEPLAGDCGYYPDWVDETREYLGTPDPGNGMGLNHPEINVIIWSCCGQVSGRTEETMISTYLAPMNQLEADYPGVTFLSQCNCCNIVWRLRNHILGREECTIDEEEDQNEKKHYKTRHLHFFKNIF